MSDPSPHIEHQGLADTAWNLALSGTSLWRPAPGPLVVVAPHPDDETLGAGGLIASCATQGSDISVVLVTDGEAAHQCQPDIRSVRVAEMRAALCCLSPRGWHLHRAQIPDGHVDEHEQELADTLGGLVPPGATLVAPFEADGHRDHNATGRACCVVAAKLKIPLVRYAVWAWRRRGVRAFDEAALVRFRLSSHAQATKARALSCYLTQAEPGLQTEEARTFRGLMFFKRPYEVYLL